MKIHKAFTLAEILIAIFIMSGIIYFQLSALKINRNTKLEAARLKNWLVNLTQTAREHQDNILFIFYGGNKILAKRTDDSMSKIIAEELFESEKFFAITLTSDIANPIYRYTTGTMSPAFTIKITDTYDTQNFYYVKCTVNGRIRIAHENDNENDDE